MSFDVMERSNYLSKPIFLYEFQIGTKIWRYSSDEIDTVLPGAAPVSERTYRASQISDNGVTLADDSAGSDIVITMRSDEEIARFFVLSPPSDETWVRMRRVQAEDLSDAPIIWIGTVSSSKQAGLRTTQFTCQALTATFNRNGLRLAWSRQCPYSLYDRQCKVNKSSYGVVVTIENIVGNVIVSDALGLFTDMHFGNGFFEFALIEGSLDRRAIEFHYDNYFNILGTPDGLRIGQVIAVYPGCNRTVSGCMKFNNMSNYGGFPQMPGKSPFSGNPVV